MKKIFHFSMAILLSSILCACFMYEERAYENPYDPNRTSGAITLEYRTMQIDGDVSDWGDIPPLVVDSTGEIPDSGGAMFNQADIQLVKMTQDNENLYFYYEVLSEYPLEMAGMSHNLSLQTENWDNHIDIFSLQHQTPDGFISNGMIEYSGLSNSNPIRFSGINPNSNAFEIGISKHSYWDSLDFNSKWRVLVYSGYRQYEDLYDGNREVDNFYDNHDDTFIILKGPDESTPSIDVPVVQFSRGTPTIDGGNGDAAIWGDFWYQDFITDDQNGSEFNTDIDKVYIKQDDENIYMLLTFADPGAFSTVNVSYFIDITSNEGTYNHSMEARRTAGVWSNVAVQYLSGWNITNCNASESIGYLEINFDKSEAWDSIPFGAFDFNIRVYDSGSILADEVRFAGSYKGLLDPAPTP